MVRDLTSGEPAATLTTLLWGSYLAHAMHVVAELGVADVLADGPQPVAAVAERVGAQTEPLSRILRTLAAAGVFTEGPPGFYALTDIGELLRSDVPGSLRDYAMLFGSELFVRAADAMAGAVRSGKSGVELVFGVPLYGYLAQHADAARVFDRGIASGSSMDDAAVLAAYDFAGVRVLADVGGGQGSLLATILEAHPAMRGLLVEREQVLSGSRTLLAARGVLDRCEVIAGDFFTVVPAGADAYLLKSVLHNWDDEHALSILRTCRQVISPSGRLLVIDPVLPPGDAPSANKMFDLVMLSLNAGGRERTETEIGGLLTRAGFALQRVLPAVWRQSIVEATPVN